MFNIETLLLYYNFNTLPRIIEICSHSDIIIYNLSHDALCNVFSTGQKYKSNTKSDVYDIIMTIQ